MTNNNKLCNYRIRQILILIVILTNTGLLGFVTAEFVIGGFPLFDVGLIIVIFYYILSLKTNNYESRIFTPVKWICLMTLIVIVSMPFRGSETIVQAFQVGRKYFILLLAFLVYDEIRINKNPYFITRLIFTLSLYYSAIAIVNYFATNIVNNIWIGIGTVHDYKGETQRHVLTSNNGILFIHIGFILQTCKIVYRKNSRRPKEILLLIFLALGVFMMGFRAVMFATLFSILLCFFLIKRSLEDYNLINFKSTIKIGALIILILMVFDFLMGHALIGIISFAGEEVSGSENGTLNVRLTRALIYQIPMILKYIWFGVGLVHYNSPMAVDMNYYQMDDKSLGLYCFDFGYGDMMVTYGLIGSIVYVSALWKCGSICLKSQKKRMDEFKVATAIWIFALLLCNYSYGALMNIQGLMPLAVLIGVAANKFEICRHKNKSIFEVVNR